MNANICDKQLQPSSQAKQTQHNRTLAHSGLQIEVVDEGDDVLAK